MRGAKKLVVLPDPLPARRRDPLGSAAVADAPPPADPCGLSQPARVRGDLLDSMAESWWAIKAASRRPLPPLRAWCVWHAVVAAFLVVNGLLRANRAPAVRFAGAILVLLGTAMLAVLSGMP